MRIIVFILAATTMAGILRIRPDQEKPGVTATVKLYLDYKKYLSALIRE